MKMLWASILLVVITALPLSAQLLPEQRMLDFQNLVALYAKRYAPYDWKRQAVGYDLFNVKPWYDRIQNAKDDLEFFEIEAEYVANLQDTHSAFSMTSSFRATIGFTVDIYDGKVLIDSISRSALPSSQYPFQIGDELVAVDGVSVQDWIDRISKWRRYGNPVTTRRVAAQQITIRVQSTFPRAVEIGDSAAVDIQRASGAVEHYTIPWSKSGYPVTQAGPVPFPKPSAVLAAHPDSEPMPNYMAALDELHNYKLPDNDPINRYVLGVGLSSPIFRSGLPSSFVQRLGRSFNDFHFSGTYTSNGLTIGYLRIPNFSPFNPTQALNELKTEIDFFQNNTDGLVVDVTRNNGGGCYMIDVAAALIPYPFYFFGEQIRATQDRLNAFQSSLEIAKLVRADQSVIDTFQSYIDQMKAALLSNRGLTGPIAACKQSTQDPFTAPAMDNNVPAAAVYSKPMIVLIDEFSISAGEIFPAMIQDNKRAPLVGTRTSGGGGSISSWEPGFYSESISSNTNTLVVRKNPVPTAEYPKAPYVENIGARPDVALDYMTRDNLVSSGRTYVDQFTQILVQQIKNPASQNLFTVVDRGGVLLSTPGTSVATTAGHCQITANGGGTTPSGFAILDYHSKGTGQRDYYPGNNADPIWPYFCGN